jgi:hypothetical protein
MKEMKKLITMMFSAMLVASLFAHSASAAYDSYNKDNDITISLQTDLINAEDYAYGQYTFETQESLHEALYNESGQEVEHSYIWIYVNGVPVLAIDPPAVMMNGTRPGGK